MGREQKAQTSIFGGQEEEERMNQGGVLGGGGAEQKKSLRNKEIRNPQFPPPAPEAERASDQRLHLHKSILLIHATDNNADPL